MTDQRHGPAKPPRGKMTTNHQHPLQKILETRIAIIDGAMGTTIRTYGMKEADIRGDALQRLEKRPAEQRRPLLPDPAEHDLRHPSPLPRSRRGHHRDQHLRRHQHHPKRILRRRPARARRPQRPRLLPERSSKTRSSTTWPGRSTKNPPSNAVNGPTASATQPDASAS